MRRAIQGVFASCARTVAALRRRPDFTCGDCERSDRSVCRRAIAASSERRRIARGDWDKKRRSQRARPVLSAACAVKSSDASATISSAGWSPPYPAPGKSGLIDQQFKQDIAIRAEPRGERHRRRHAVEPFAAGLLGPACLAAVQRSGVGQAHPRHHAAARLNTDALHHLAQIVWSTWDRRSHSGLLHSLTGKI